MITELILLCLALVLLYKLLPSKPHGLPPGEWGYPIIGKLPPSGVPILDFLTEMKNKYGDIFSLKMGGRLYVVLSDFNLIKSAFNRAELSGRPNYYSYGIFYYFKNIGLAGSNDKVWDDTRKFTMKVLSNLGMGKSFLEDIISTEVKELIKELDKNVKEPVELSWMINAAAINIIWGMASSKRHDINDPQIVQFSEWVNKQLDYINGPMRYFDMFPWSIPYMPKLIQNRWMKIDKFIKYRDTTYNFLMESILEHKKHLNKDDPKDYIDHFLIEIENEKDNPDTVFKPDLDNLVASIYDLFITGSETTATSIRYTCLYLIKYPEVQKRIQKEIDQFVSPDRLPSLEDRHNLVYMEAALLEVQRKISLTPLGVAHAAMIDTEIGGYQIPKGTTILPNQNDCHSNPKYWEKPDDFYPEHFIDENNKLISKKNGYLPFSIGRRFCLGENLAKTELFLFMSGLLQKFSFSAPPGDNLDIKFDRDSIHFNVLKPYKVMLTRRN